MNTHANTIFLSWSGDASRDCAQALANWLPEVIKGVKTWYSPKDIAVGTFWANELQDILSKTAFAVICVTRENLNAPWLHFEAGAVSKGLSKNLIVPYLIDVQPLDLKGPLCQLQVAQANKEGTRNLVQRLYESAVKNTPSPNAIEKLFKKAWPKLERQIGTALASARMSRIKRGDFTADQIPDSLEKAAFKKFIGVYEGYHLSTVGGYQPATGDSSQLLVVTSVMEIRYKGGNLPEVLFSSFGYQYRGLLRIMDTNLYILLEGVGHSECLTVILKEPLTRQFGVLAGVYSAVTEKRDPAVGKILFRKSRHPARCRAQPANKFDQRVVRFLTSNLGNPIVVGGPNPPTLDGLTRDLNQTMTKGKRYGS